MTKPFGSSHELLQENTESNLGLTQQTESVIYRGTIICSRGKLPNGS